MSAAAEQEFWRRAWLQELGVEWRGPLPFVIQADEGPIAAEADASPATLETPAQAGHAQPENIASTDAPSANPESDAPAKALAVPVVSGGAAEPPNALAEPEQVPPTISAEQAEAPSAATTTTVAAPATPVVPAAMAETAAAAPTDRAEPPSSVAGAREFSLPGPWRWSWWKGSQGGKLTQALLLRPANAPRASDAAARDVLAAALAAVELTPALRSSSRPAGGLREQALDVAALREFASQSDLTQAGSLTVLLCLPAEGEGLLAEQSGVAEAVPGGHWTLPGDPAIRLVLLPAPERLLLGAAVKRVAWRALAPLRAG